MELLSVYTAMGFAFSVFIGSSLPKNQATHNFTCGSLCVCCLCLCLLVKTSLGVQMCLCIWQGWLMGANHHHLSSCKGVHNEGSEFGATLESIPLQYCRGTSKKRAMWSNQLGRFVRMLVSSLPESGFLHCPVPKPTVACWKLTMPLFYLVIPFWWVPPARFSFFTWCYNLQHFQSRQTHKVRVAEPPGRFYAYARHTLIFYRGV